MRTDIVIPKENEQKFITIAEKLGYKELIFLYRYEKNMKFEDIKKNLEMLSKKTELEISPAIIVASKDYQKARKITKKIFIDSKEHDDDKIRNLIEKQNPFMIYNLEYQKKDFIHHRNSGLNHVTARFMKENNIVLGFSFSLILHTNSRDFIFGRISQNIRFMRKFKFKALIASFAKDPYEMRSPDDLKSLFITLGMHPKEAEESLNI
ncbi:MAG: RNase P subunit p30 family protein [Candidatus Woesearchaeota archaeon]